MLIETSISSARLDAGIAVAKGRRASAAENFIMYERNFCFPVDFEIQMLHVSFWEAG